MLNSVGERTPPCGTPVLNCIHCTQLGIPYIHVPGLIYQFIEMYKLCCTIVNNMGCL